MRSIRAVGFTSVTASMEQLYADKQRVASGTITQVPTILLSALSHNGNSLSPVVAVERAKPRHTIA